MKDASEGRQPRGASGDLQMFWRPGLKLDVDSAAILLNGVDEAGNYAGLIAQQVHNTAAESGRGPQNALPCLSWLRGTNCKGLEETLILL